MIPKLARLLELHEGRRLKPYTDTVGKLTIGVGRNLTDNGISDLECDVLLANDMHDVEADLHRVMPWVFGLDDVRQAVLADMRFNLGLTKFLKFKRTLALVKNREHDAAAEAMLNSLWAHQTKSRAKRDAAMMETGEWPPELA